MLTLVYITSRKDPCFRWFLDSLKLQTDQVCKSIRIVVVDSHAAGRTEEKLMLSDLGTNWSWTHPKPSVWQGPHRLTSKDYFAASNARNTGLCLAPDGWIAYVDDLSVLMPGWLNCVQEAMAGNYIVLGAYRKVKNLLVENGVVSSFTEYPAGNDSRWNQGNDSSPVPAIGGWMYGCSVAMPVEALLKINGWPEDLCDGLGSEDYCCGIALQNSGCQFKYDRRMLTYESEELHFVDQPMAKDDWHFEDGKPVRGGNGRDDKSHAALNIAIQSTYFPNHFNIRELRDKVLAGEPFPVDQNPAHEWFTKIPLKDL